MNKALGSLVFRILGLIISSLGVILHLLEKTPSDTGFMINHKPAYFTIQTNIMIALLFLFLVCKTVQTLKDRKQLQTASFHPSLHLCLSVYITITMLGFWLLLVPVTGLARDPALLLNSLTLHLITPLWAITDYLLFVPHGHVKMKDIPAWMIYPVLYLISVFLLSRVITEPYYSFVINGNKISLMMPYPFLDPSVMGSVGVIAAILSLFLFFLLLSWLAVRLDWKLGKIKKSA